MNDKNNEAEGATHIGWRKVPSGGKSDMDHLVLGTKQNPTQTHQEEAFTKNFNSNDEDLQKRKESPEQPFLEVNDTPIETPSKLLGAHNDEE